MLIADKDLRVVLGADRFEPFRARIGVARLSLADRPRPRQSMISDFAMQDVPIGFVQINALLEDRLIVLMKRQAGGIVFPGFLEAARFNLQNVVVAIAWRARGRSISTERPALALRQLECSLTKELGQQTPWDTKLFSLKSKRALAGLL